MICTQLIIYVTEVFFFEVILINHLACGDHRTDLTNIGSGGCMIRKPSP